mmetsp:Transcript_4383/g.11917  ORF Transcript_4383/g.11917 Transcript_4383/m.11917 type:complete len:794 (+) Transcript_4383:128-2509(+)
MSDKRRVFLLANMTPAQKRALAVLVVAGGVGVGHKLRNMVLGAQAVQKQLTKEMTHGKPPGARRINKIAVNRQFLNRLITILKICMPSPFSKEALLVLVQGLLLVSRTLLTDLISRVEGWSGSSLIALQFESFAHSLMSFALMGIPAAVVNAGLKFMQKQIEMAFQSRLTTHLHKMYCSNRAYYAASTLGGMMNPDQRITEDVEKFCFSVSDLYAHTLKPLLDVILFTRSLSKNMGYRGQFGLYVYYMVVAYILKAMSPPMAQMTAMETALSGSFRAAHVRLVSHAEEIAFNDPPGGPAEQLILNQHLKRMLKYSRMSAFQRFIQQIADNFFVKYFATVTALLVYAAPVYFKDPALRGTQGELTNNYIRSMRLLQNTSRGVGDLILVYKRVAGLASHTSRVSELLEQVTALSAEDAEHRELFNRNVSHTKMGGIAGSVASSGDRNVDVSEAPPTPKRLHGPHISFYRLALDSPDGQPLFRELTFEVVPGRSVMLMGPNGCGKSSLFRVLAGLWPLQTGEVTTPAKHQLFYLSQRPYLVAGTLRDQLLYPFPPRAVWGSASAKERKFFEQAACDGPSPPAVISGELDARLEQCLRAVDLQYLLARGAGWEQVQPWQETLSGGEKQRLAMARLLYHQPQYAVLDECTSAVSADGEFKLYEACERSGITFLSIAHRPALKRFHDVIIHFDANLAKSGRGWWAETLQHEHRSQQNAAASQIPSQLPIYAPHPAADARAPTQNGSHAPPQQPSSTKQQDAHASSSANGGVGGGAAAWAQGGDGNGGAGRGGNKSSGKR